MNHLAYKSTRVTFAKCFYAALSCFVLLTLAGCSEDPPAAVPQGIITYDVTFPFNTNELLTYVYPEEMIVAFHGDQITGSLEAMGGVVANQFIVNNKQKVFDQFLKSTKGKFHITLDSAGVVSMLTDSPGLKMIPTDSTAMIAGYECNLTMAEFLIDSVPAIELWHTSAIPIEDPNWCNQYKDLDAYLLGYDVEHLGMRMRLRAREVSITEVDLSRFELLEGYKQVDYAGMKAVITDMMAILEGN